MKVVSRKVMNPKSDIKGFVDGMHRGTKGSYDSICLQDDQRLLEIKRSLIEVLDHEATALQQGFRDAISGGAEDFQK